MHKLIRQARKKNRQKITPTKQKNDSFPAEFRRKLQAKARKENEPVVLPVGFVLNNSARTGNVLTRSKGTSTSPDVISLSLASGRMPHEKIIPDSAW